MPYRSAERAVANALEEQRELLELEGDRKRRHRKTAIVLAAIFAGLIGFIEFQNFKPPSHRYVCNQVVREYEPSAPGREPRPPDTWVACEWR